LIAASTFATAALARSSSVVEAAAVSEAATSEDGHLHPSKLVLDFLRRVALQNVMYDFGGGKVCNPLAVAGLLHRLHLLGVFRGEQLRLCVIYGVSSSGAWDEADENALRGFLSGRLLGAIGSVLVRSV
jgi:hypothetical protein